MWKELKMVVCVLKGHNWSDWISKKDLIHDGAFIKGYEILETRHCVRCGKKQEIQRFEKEHTLLDKLWKQGKLPKVEYDTIERCPHVASGERKAVASVIISPTRIKEVCPECLKSHKSPFEPSTKSILISKPRHPKPSSKFFKPEPIHAKRLRKPGAKLEDEEDN